MTSATYLYTILALIIVLAITQIVVMILAGALLARLGEILTQLKKKGKPND